MSIRKPLPSELLHPKPVLEDPVVTESDVRRMFHAAAYLNKWMSQISGDKKKDHLTPSIKAAIAAPPGTSTFVFMISYTNRVSRDYKNQRDAHPESLRMHRKITLILEYIRSALQKRASLAEEVCENCDIPLYRDGRKLGVNYPSFFSGHSV